MEFTRRSGILYSINKKDFKCEWLNLKVFTAQGRYKQSVDGQAQLDEAANNGAFWYILCMETNRVDPLRKFMVESVCVCHLDSILLNGPSLVFMVTWTVFFKNGSPNYKQRNNTLHRVSQLLSNADAICSMVSPETTSLSTSLNFYQSSITYRVWCWKLEYIMFSVTTSHVSMHIMAYTSKEVLDMHGDMHTFHQWFFRYDLPVSL